MLDPQDLSIPWSNIAGQRLTVKLRYGTRPFCTLELEVVAASRAPEFDYVPALSLENIGIETPDAIPCLGLGQQIAEKLHACSDPLDDNRVNDRVNDIMDLIIIEDLAGSDLDLPATRSHCLRIFDERSTHPWPPVLTVLPGWKNLWTRMSEDNSFYIDDITTAVARANQLIERIDGSP